MHFPGLLSLGDSILTSVQSHVRLILENAHEMSQARSNAFVLPVSQGTVNMLSLHFSTSTQSSRPNDPFMTSFQWDYVVMALSAPRFMRRLLSFLLAFGCSLPPGESESIASRLTLHCLHLSMSWSRAEWNIICRCSGTCIYILSLYFMPAKTQNICPKSKV